MCAQQIESVGDQNFKRRRFSDTQPFNPSSVRTKYIQPPGCRSPSITVSEVPGRTIGPGLLLDESTVNEMLPPGAISSAVTVTFCPSPNIGLSEVTSGAAGLAVVGGATGGAAGAASVGEGATGAEGVGAWALGLGAGCGAGTDGAIGGGAGAGTAGFGLMVVIGGGGVLSPR